jgi:AcrR family transcriptional regulator
MTIDEVAGEAGVARASVFRHYTCKAELLRAVEADAARRAGAAELVAAVSALPPLEALRRAIWQGGRVWAAEATIFREFYGEAPFDDALRPLVVAKEAQRRDVVGEIILRLHEAGRLAATSPAAREVAIDAVWLLTGFATFDALTALRGLGPDEASGLIERTVCGAYVEQGEGDHEQPCERDARSQ